MAVRLFLAGLLIPFIEPLFKLAGGDDLGGAFWPSALRTLEWTFFLREYNTFIFGFFLILIPIVVSMQSSITERGKQFCMLLLGCLFGLLLIFFLLDMAYMRGAFILLPTIYGILIFTLCICIGGKPTNPFAGSFKPASGVQIAGILFAVWLISPGLSSMAGIAPSPPELNLQTGQYSFDTTIHPYPMPQEVSSIQGDYESDIEFSVYLSMPVGEDEIPLAIIMHGFANPFFDTYYDWIEHLASRGIAVAFIQYPSDVRPEGHDTFILHEEAGMSNHPYHVPRALAMQSGLSHLEEILPNRVNTDHLLIGGHSLGAGYALMIMDWSLAKGWGNQSLIMALEAPYARPVQDHLQIDTSGIPSEFIAQIAVSEDDMSVDDCFGVHHQILLGENSLMMEIPSDRHGFPRLVASHYIQATETHDTLADWGFYRRVVNQADWLNAQHEDDEDAILDAEKRLTNPELIGNMGEWSDGTPVKSMPTWDDAINSKEFEYCKTWTGS